MAANSLKSGSYRKRLPRYKFEASDRTLLQNLVNKYMGILERKATNQNMLEEKKRCWALITNKFNSQSRDKRIRDAKQLRKCWENMKWRARRDAKKASIHNPSQEFDNSRMSDLVGVEEFMNDGEFDDDDEEIDDDDEGEDEDDEDDEEEEIMAPMGTESILIDEDHIPLTNGNDPLTGHPRIPPHHNLPVSHPPDEELIGSFVGDSWIADDAVNETDDQVQVQVKTEMLEVEPIRETHIWNGMSSLVGPPTNVINHVPLLSSDNNHDVNHAPSISSSAGDAAESVSSQHTAKSSSCSKRSYENVNHVQNTVSAVAVDADPVSTSSIEEAEQRLRTDEEHAKRMELLQVQLDYEKAKVERMRRLMEMSEMEHRAKMRMMVRYQQVAEKQKEYWSYNVDTVVMQQGIPPTDEL